MNQGSGMMWPMQATTATTSVALDRLDALSVHCEYGRGRSGLMIRLAA